MKKITIRSKVQKIFMYITFAAMLLTSAAGIISMVGIQKISEKALTKQTEDNIDDIAYDRAELADTELGSYTGIVQHFADILHGLYSESEAYLPREILPADIKNANIYAMQRTLASKDIDVNNIIEDVRLLGNIAPVWRAVMNANKDIITTIYFGTKNGFMLAYDDQSQVALPESGDTEVYYNYFASDWYQKAYASGKPCFTDIYSDIYGRGMMITCAVPFFDANDSFAGVVAMDILISDLYRSIVYLTLGEGSYAFLVDGRGNIISPSDINNNTVQSLSQEKDITQTITAKILNGETGVSLSDNGMYYSYSPIKSTGWKFCIKIPQTLIIEPVNNMKRNVILTIIFFVAAFIVLLVIVTVIARVFSERLTKPIIALGKDVHEISSGKLDHRAEIRTNDEIGDLAQDFNDMAASLKDYIKNLAAVTKEKERIGAELNVATQIQADMLPKILPPYLGHEKFEMFATMNPAKEVGGDFYDFFLIDDDHLALVMADVSGKGVPAALFMVIAKTLIKNRSFMGGTPGEILADVNDQLCEGNEADLFVTVWFGILELSTGKVTASNAGHEYPAIKRADGKFELYKTKQSPAVATMEGMRFRETEFTLNHGDCLYIYTDGVPEATNIHEELYGTDRMLEALDSTSGMSAEEILHVMKKSVDDFTGEAPQFDDVTMLYLKFMGGKTEEMHELVVDAQTEKLDEVLDFIGGYLEEWNCPMKTQTQINIAVEEIFVNIAHYSYENHDGKAKITITRKGSDAEITFTDSGIPYDPLAKPDPDVTLSAEERQIGGLGIYIVKKSMDSVSYEYRDAKNILVISKKIG